MCTLDFAFILKWNGGIRLSIPKTVASALHKPPVSYTAASVMLDTQYVICTFSKLYL